MSESIRAMRDNAESFLSDGIICTLHLVGKGIIWKDGSFAHADAHWASIDFNCTKCAYHDDCALMKLEE